MVVGRCNFTAAGRVNPVQSGVPRARIPSSRLPRGYLGTLDLDKITLRHAVEILAFHGRLSDPRAHEVIRATAFNSVESGGDDVAFPTSWLFSPPDPRPATVWCQERGTSPSACKENLRGSNPQQFGVRSGVQTPPPP